MRTLYMTLIGLTMASGVWAQEPAAQSGKFYAPKEWASPNGFLLNAQPVVVMPVKAAPPPAVTRCVIPLLQAPVPQGIDPAIEFTPHNQATDPMPRAMVPPVCDAAPSR